MSFTNDFGTKFSESYDKSLVERYFEDAVTPKITNNDYEGDTKSNKYLNILTVEGGQLENYTGADLTLEDVKESNAQLVIDQAKSFYFKVDTTDEWISYASNPESSVVKKYAGQLQEAIDSYVLGFHTDVASGNRVGTDYTTGTVAVDVAGVVTGTGTTFTADMVGLGFKAAGHTKWYRIKTFTSATSITIENDSDDEVSAYDGGIIAGGATYVIEAATPIAVTVSNAYDLLRKINTKLTKSKIPTNDRWFVAEASFMEALLGNSVVVRDTLAGEERTKNGMVGMLAGLKLYSNEQVSGNNTTGYWALAGIPQAITFALGLKESGVEDRIGNFGTAYKNLTIYGAKVVDERRKALAALRYTV